MPCCFSLYGNGSLITGAMSATLNIFSTDPADAGAYDCVLTNACGTSRTPPATLTVCIGCTADFDCDCQVNLSDFETFFPEKRPFFIEGASIFRFGRGGANNNWGWFF